MTAAELRELADRITAHLERFEADPEINAPRTRTRRTHDGGETVVTLPRFVKPYASASRGCVYVSYISFQGEDKLSGDEAAAYLAALDAGFVGRHTQALA
jgi:hypothetical protein